MTVAEVARNGTAAVRMPIKTVDIVLDEIGYQGWVVTMRTNPRSSVYDGLVDPANEPRWWASFGQVVLAWNFVDEDGQALPQPSAVSSEQELDLPISLLGFVLSRYFEAVKAAAAIPKAPSDNSARTSSTSVGDLTSA